MYRVAFAAMALCATWAFAQPGSSFQDDFKSYPPESDGSPAWETDGLGWSVAPGGKFVAETRDRSWALCVKTGRARIQTIEATLTVTGSVAEGWKAAGLLLQDDDRNYWHLALVESPNADGAKHFIELQESYDGQWLASLAEKTRLTIVENQGFEWQKNHPYRLRLDLAAETLSGTVSELGGAVRGRIVLKLDNPLVVNTGTAGLDCSGFRAEVTDFAVNVTQAAPPKSVPVLTCPPFDAKGCADIHDTATGFFGVKQQDGRWWLITPKGEGFYALGADHVNYMAGWCEKLGYAPYHQNCAAKYHGDEEAWGKSASDRLKAWNFNALGCGWSPTMKGKGLPRCEFINFGSGFAALDDIAPPEHWTGFPNVFSPKWPIYCDKRARSYCGPLKGDPWIIGYFLDNELEWFGKDYKPWGLFDECLKKPRGHSAKDAALAFLQSRYPRIEAFNAAWKTQFADWKSVADSTAAIETSAPQADKDRLDFIRLIAEKYFTVTNAAMKKYDPNHLNLGCRFAGFMPPGAIEECGQNCDVVTVNFYGQVDLERGVSPDMPKAFADYAGRCRRPMMITEWSFPAYDSGLPCEHGAGQRVATQAEKARCFRVYQSDLMRFPFMVGSMYFMWADEPALGISSTFPEDSNYGLVDVNDCPWPELTQAATRVNGRVYEIHSGKTPQIAVTLAPDGRSLALANSGGAEGSFALHVWVDGEETVSQQGLLAGAKVKMAAPDNAAAAGGHLITASVDPEETLEDDRSNHMATRLVYVPGAKWPSPAGAAISSRIPVLVSNPSPQPLAQARFDQVLPEITHGALTTAAGGSVACQFDVDGKQGELSFDAGALPPCGCKTFFLYPAGAAALEGTPAVKAQVQGNAFEVTNGPLTLKHAARTGDLLTSITSGDLLLGRLQGLVQQQIGQNLWVTADKTESVQCHNGPVRFTADLTMAMTQGGETKTTAARNGTYAPQSVRPHRFRACYRIVLYPGQPCFTSRLLWIENTDAEPWRLAAVYHCALSNIGGDQADDTPAKRLPAGMAAWTNTKFDGALGCVSINPDDFKMMYWRDPGPNGVEHADVWRDIGVTLKPGERYDAPQPAALFFGSKSAAQAVDIAGTARAQGRVQCQLFEAEGR